MIHFSCPHCRAALSAPAERAGRRSTCPSCKQRVQVPGGPPAAVLLAPGEGPASPPPVATWVPEGRRPEVCAASPAVPAAGPARPGRRRTRVVLAALVLACLVALAILAFRIWTSREPVEAGPAVASQDGGGGTSAPDSGKAAPAGEDEPVPTPVLSLSVNGTRKVEHFQSWPLLVHVRLHHPRAFDEAMTVAPMLLAAPQGSWSTAIQLEVKDGGRKAAAWPWHLDRTPKGSHSLDVNTPAGLDLWLAPEETAQIPESDYELTAVLDTTVSVAPGAWKGKTSSEVVSIRLRKEPASLSGVQQEQKYLLLANFDVLRGQIKQAFAHVDQLLAKQPKSIGGLSFKADLLTVTDRLEEALKVNGQAIDAVFAKYPKLREPPHDLLRKRRALFNALARDKRK
jgi:hypothetical protein